MGTFNLIEGQLYRVTYKPSDSLATYADVFDISGGAERGTTRTERVQLELFSDDATGASTERTRVLVVAAEQGHGSGWLADPDELTAFHDAIATSNLPPAHFDLPPIRAHVDSFDTLVPGEGMSAIIKFELVGSMPMPEPSSSAKARAAA